MADPKLVPKSFLMRLEGDVTGKKLVPIAARVSEGLSRITEMRVEFVCEDENLKLGDLVGVTMNLVHDTPDKGQRKFCGTCVAAEYVGQHDRYALFAADVRPWLWFLNRRTNCRIFQDETVEGIFDKIIEDYGFSGDVEKNLTGSYRSRTYCTQYRESDFDFISRLLEEEGIYYFFDHSSGTEKMVLMDSPGGHKNIPGKTKISYVPRSKATQSQKDHVYDWGARERALTGKVMLDDYNFETPKALMEVLSSMPKGTHGHKDYEHYDYPGAYRVTSEGDHYAKVRMESEAVRFKTWAGVSNAMWIGTGQRFEVEKPPRKDDAKKVCVIAADHFLEQDLGKVPGLEKMSSHRDRLGLLTSGDSDRYAVSFLSIPDDVQYRAPQVTPQPQIAGVQTAVVVGPSGEEIYPDKYGRIKVLFHWDREGKPDDKASCWIRVSMPWTGKNWGMMAIPRIGNEVVVQFEEGDCDRPLITGMLYNADNMPPYDLPGKKNISGIKTNSTKGGGGFNELRFDDTKGSELVHFRSEHNYEQVVQNDATITVGLEDKDKGDMELTVHHDLTETVKTGDHTFTVEKGSEFITIHKDQKTKIETGNMTHEVSRGKRTEKVSLGNYSLTTPVGKQKFQAGQEILLKVGASSIKIDNSGVTIKGLMVKIEGTAMFEAKAPFSQVKGDALLILKGGFTFIN